MFNNCLSFQSAGPGYGVGLHANSILKTKCHNKKMITFGVSSSSPSYHQARSSKSDPYNHSQQVYKDELGLKIDQVQTFPLEIPLEEEGKIGEATSEQEEGGKGKEEILGLEMKNPDTIKPRKQMMRRSIMIAKQVISIHSALALGFVSELWVDTVSWTVLIVEVRPNLLSGELERLFLEDIAKVGDVLLIEDESVMENDFKLLGLETLVGYTVVTPGRRTIGKVRGYTFDINSGAVEWLELDSFGISIIPSSLVSTYGLFVEDVVEVSADTVVVHESRIQRLTKGILGGGSASSKKKKKGKKYAGNDDEFEEDSVDGRLRDDDSEASNHENDYRQRMKGEGGFRFSRNKFVGRGEKKVEDSSVEWELPMDYL